MFNNLNFNHIFGSLYNDMKLPEKGEVKILLDKFRQKRKDNKEEFMKNMRKD